MSYLTPPQNVTGSILVLNNPGTVQNSAAPVAVQVRNASGYVLTVSALKNQMIDPFTATTIEIATGENLVINPSFDAYSKLSGYLSAEWLLPKESPTEPDGPLTSAATIASISGDVTTIPAPIAPVWSSNNLFISLGSVITSGWLNVNTIESLLCHIVCQSVSTGGGSPLVTLDWSFDGSNVAFTEQWQMHATVLSGGGGGTTTTFVDYLPVLAPYCRFTFNDSSLKGSVLYNIGAGLSPRKMNPLEIVNWNFSGLSANAATVTQYLGGGHTGLTVNPFNSLNPYPSGEIEIALFNSAATGSPQWILTGPNGPIAEGIPGTLAINYYTAPGQGAGSVTRLTISRDTHSFQLVNPDSANATGNLTGYIRSTGQ